MLHTIDRITAEQAKFSFREYLFNQKPVIITDLYPNHPLLSVNSPEKMVQKLGHVELIVGQNYYDKFLMTRSGGERFKDYVIPLERYITILQEVPSTNLLCREQGLPPSLQDYALTPDLIQNLPTPDPIHMMYVANNNTVAPLHFDLDLREVLFTQMVGVKKIYLVKPEYGARFLPIRNFCGIPVHQFNDDEKKNFFAFNEAHYCELLPSETLYIPKLWWHLLENVGITMASSVRFGVSPHTRRLGSLPHNYLKQNIAYALIDPLTSTATDEKIIDDLMALHFSSYNSELERARIFYEKWTEIYRQVCPKAIQAEYLPQWFSEDVWANAEKMKVLFGILEIHHLGDGVLTEPCPQAALEKLKIEFERNEYSSTRVQRLIDSFGFQGPLENLTLLQATTLYNLLERQHLKSTNLQKIIL